jgi:hypothetical protein
MTSLAVDLYDLVMGVAIQPFKDSFRGDLGD